MDRIKRYAQQLLDKYPDLFTASYEENKKVLEKVAVINSKQLRNELAGYITRYMSKGQDKKQIIEEVEAKEAG
jgi:small subunit ribosomal protein S17e